MDGDRTHVAEKGTVTDSWKHSNATSGFTDVVMNV